MTDSGDEYGVAAHIIEKNSKEQIRIGVNEYQGTEYIDVRMFYSKDGDWKPSPKGVTIPPDRYPELLRGVIELGGLVGYLSGEQVSLLLDGSPDE